MSGFAKLIPAFSAHICIEPPTPVGAVSRGNNLSLAPFIPSSGYLKSEPSYPLKVDAIFQHGSDYIRMDPGGEHFRLDVVSLVKDKVTGAMIKYDYTGTIDATGAAGKVLRGEADAKTTDFGEAFTHIKFEVGAPELKEMEHKVYVASGRFILEPSKPVTVEYKVSEVAL